MKSPDHPRHFRVLGLDCAEEVAILKREVGPIVGGSDRISFHVLQGKMTISAEAASVPTQKVVEAVAGTGMRAEIWQVEPKNTSRKDLFWMNWGRAILTSISGALIVLGFALHLGRSGGFREMLGPAEPNIPWIVRGVYGLAMIAGAWLVLPKAWHALKRLRPDMNLLMTIAVLGAAAIGEWFEGATVAFLFSLSLLLESWSIGKARRAIEALMDLAPPTVRILRNGLEEELSPDDVTIGTRFIVRPGERLSLDGRIVEGTSYINQAPITGESQPVAKKMGEDVFAGTINGDGALVIECTKLANDTTLAHIIRMVGEAHSRRAPSEQWVEKFARIYTPTVMFMALAVLFFPPVLFAQPWETWIYNSLVLLVIACPCALVISTPVSIVAALACAARNGVLIKGGVFVEVPARLSTIVFDKTGTITEGQPVVVEVVPLAGHDEGEVLDRAAALEARSEHPLAKAILSYAAEKGITPIPASDFQILPGKGAEGKINDRIFWLGSHRYLLERGQETPALREKLDAMMSQGRSVIVLGNADHACGLIAVADPLRSGAKQAVEHLEHIGIKRLLMLTGDNEATAKAIARDAGITEFRAELLPEEKVAAIEELVEKGESVAMVGDGINDAPALARATLGIAMGAAGTDAAIETADIALMSDDLGKLPWLIRHSRRTLSIIRQNIAFSLTIKAVFVLLTVAGMASLWAAIAADMGASLLVIFNGLRLLHQE